MYNELLEEHTLFKLKLVFIKNKGKQNKKETYEKHWASLKAKV